MDSMIKWYIKGTLSVNRRMLDTNRYKLETDFHGKGSCKVKDDL
jgi:hypothetical protein